MKETSTRPSWAVGIRRYCTTLTSPATPIAEAPSDLLLVIRVMGCRRGIGKQIGSRVDPMSVMLLATIPAAPVFSVVLRIDGLYDST